MWTGSGVASSVKENLRQARSPHSESTSSVGGHAVYGPSIRYDRAMLARDGAFQQFPP